MTTRSAWTAEELMAHSFPPPKWAVPGLLAEGANLLAGPPKVGKSWLSINLAVAVASGTRALAGIDVVQGDVLYLALEDTGRRLQSRLRKVLDGSPAPAGLTFATFCEVLNAGGRERICGWLDEHPAARLVIVDVLARVRGSSAGASSNAYELDYAAVANLKAIADNYGVAFLIVHHVRKSGSEDFVDTVSGTNGLAGAADAILVLKRARGDADAELHLTGRDVEESTRALRFAPEQGAWQVLDGPAEDYQLGDTRRDVVAYLRKHVAATPTEISRALELKEGTAKSTLWRMANADQLDTDGRGSYFLPATSATPATEGCAGCAGCTPEQPALA